MNELVENRIEGAKKELAKEDRTSNGVAIHLKKGETIEVENGPCHGFIRLTGRPHSQAIVSRLIREVGDYYHNQRQILDVLPFYYDWLFNRSPWQDVYVTKDANKALVEKACVLRVDQPGNMTQAALIATRHTWEYPSQISLWHKLVHHHGVPEHLAFLAVFSFSTSENGEVYPSCAQCDHTTIAVNRMTKEGMKAFVSNSPLYTTEPFNQEGSYRGVHSAFEGKGTPLYSDIQEAFDSYSSKTSLLELNPFRKAKKTECSGRNTMDVKEFASFVKDTYPSLIK